MTMAFQQMKWQVFFSFIFCFNFQTLSGQIHYYISEELKIGVVVGNIAKDLALNTQNLSYRNLHLHSDNTVQYFRINLDNGDLHIHERIDREKICGEEIDCNINFEANAENPLNIFHIKMTIQDINDNAPSFISNNTELEVSESTTPGASFSLGNAHDPDIGSNSLQGYRLNANPCFSIRETQNKNGNKYAELFLEKYLDREIQSTHSLILTAFDGGDPVRTGTMQIKIIVTDFNDNAPVFSSDIYKTSLQENAQKGFLVLQVNAHDVDEGVNGQITYSFSNVPANARNIFNLDPDSGEITIYGTLDFEEIKAIRMGIEAKDGGGLASHCTLLIEVVDDNDNAPEIKLASVITSVPEDAPPGTVIALINVNDKDSGENGKVTCQIQDQTSMTLVSVSGNYYKLITKNILDRESVSSYNITVIAWDNGKRPLSSSTVIPLQITDINDNVPRFQQSSYTVYVPENNHPGVSIYKVIAEDFDLGKNSQIIYSILAEHVDNALILSSLSINSHTGIIYAQHMFDYEQMREFQIIVNAQDNGDPPLSSNVTLQVFVIDMNDNSPKMLYPTAGVDGSVMFELVPPSSESEYLVTKVVAVDSDSGHNAWLFYHLIESTSSGLFSIGLHTGEIRMSRSFMEKDAMKQKIVIQVTDNGIPSLSATVTLNMVFAETIKEALPEVTNIARNVDIEPNLNFYLVLALALISFLFLVTVLVLLTKRCLKQTSALPPEIYGHGNLPYPYELYFATNSGKREFPVMGSNGENGNKNNVSTDNSALLLMCNENVSLNCETDANAEVNP